MEELSKNGKPQGDKYIKKVKYKGNTITCHVYVCKENIDDDRLHMIYSVFGKRIKNEKVNWSNEIKKEYSNRVFCIADVSILASCLTSNKENFRKDYLTSKIKKITTKTFYDELKEHNLIFSYQDITQNNNVVFNELTIKLDKILQNPELKFLNPFSNPRTHAVVIPDDTGDIPTKDTSGQQSVSGTKRW